MNKNRQHSKIPFKMAARSKISWKFGRKNVILLLIWTCETSITTFYISISKFDNYLLLKWLGVTCDNIQKNYNSIKSFLFFLFTGNHGMIYGLEKSLYQNVVQFFRHKFIPYCKVCIMHIFLPQISLWHNSLGPSVMIFVFVGIFAIKWFLGLNGRVIPSHLRNPLAPFFSITRMAAILDFKMAAIIVCFCGLFQQ